MKTHLAPLAVSVLVCIFNCATADTSLADKSLAQATSSHITSKAVTLKKPPQTEKSFSTAPSNLEAFVDKAEYISKGAGIFGKQITTIVKKDVVGLEYSMQW